MVQAAARAKVELVRIERVLQRAAPDEMPPCPAARPREGKPAAALGRQDQQLVAAGRAGAPSAVSVLKTTGTSSTAT